VDGFLARLAPGGRVANRNCRLHGLVGTMRTEVLLFLPSLMAMAMKNSPAPSVRRKGRKITLKLRPVSVPVTMPPVQSDFLGAPAFLAGVAMFKA